MRNILFITALSSATANQKTPLKNDEDDMHAFARNFMAAYNQSDIATIRKMYSEYAVRIDENGKEMTGSDIIADYFTHEFQSNKTTLLLKQTGLTWSDADRAWVARGTYEVYGRTIVYDIEIQRKGAYANTMIKDKDQWKIAKSVLTPLPRQKTWWSWTGCTRHLPRATSRAHWPLWIPTSSGTRPRISPTQTGTPISGPMPC
jgi:ketosteroid isomerase-like protein